GAWYWSRFRVNGTSVQLRQWADGDAEPGAWDTTTTDAAIASGFPALTMQATSEVFEVAFYGVGTVSDPAPGPISLPTPMDQWCLGPDEELERTVQLEYLDPSTGLVGTAWFSDKGRITGPTDYPPSTEMWPLLQDPGGYGV